MNSSSPLPDETSTESNGETELLTKADDEASALIADESSDEDSEDEELDDDAPQICGWRNQADAVREMARFTGKTQSQRHIKPIHWYIACRLVIEGGFMPHEVTPHPPIRAEKAPKSKKYRLLYDPTVATGNEQTIIGGMKTKNVDVVVSKPSIGPVLAISCKGMTKSLRNLTNRMEETIGESTNLHVTYPALVFGYLFVMRGNREETIEASISESDSKKVAASKRNDIAIGKDDNPVASLVRFHYALSQMGGRKDVRSEPSRYESVALAIADDEGQLLDSFPPLDSSTRMENFFATLYSRYYERMVINAMKLKTLTARHVWAPDSPIFDTDFMQLQGLAPVDYPIRID